MSEFQYTDEQKQQNALAWLMLTDNELIERSASLDMPPELHIEPHLDDTVEATQEQIDQMRVSADMLAREWAGDEFCNKWIAENRSEV
jgi:hypothetical protein